ncbi:PucR family transcriptional regulator [Bacillus salipaludis]|uniref:PucR family transcriptional regulator n=1 Tax=Bacillus salipaludis TaxID=2547811 RepID=A0A4R5VZL4_9BACI|nr:PucR family transcriptional regulator [Bacillus salipaludis]MDQ6596694.1 PucR family transcriptional regulator ligand-binding domain-containing protein [Bacillus salipaludis]TDK65080.1 PucR family transcriptional regulator [Bacillus salipaludis]
MAIRIHEALQLPIMQQTKLIAGKNGLQNWVKWVTIVEVIEDINRLQEGEFLITTGFGLGEDEEKQSEFKRLLALGKLSGVALYTGLYLKEIPQSFISIADQHALPLIEIPANINFSMITKELLEQIVNKQREIFVASDFLQELLTQPIVNPTDVMERGKKLGIDFTKPQTIFSVHFAGLINEGVKEQLIEAIQSILKNKKIPCLIRTKSDSMIVLLEVSDRWNISEIAKEFLKSMEPSCEGVPISIGIGKTAANLNILAESARQAEQASYLSQILFKPQPIVHYDDFSLYQLLLEMKNSGVSLEEFYHQYLGNLLDTRGVDLITTLEAYLYFNQNIKNTAEDLYIHRHTLKYRLGQIEKKTGANLSSFEDCTKLYLAILAYKLVNYKLVRS